MLLYFFPPLMFSFIYFFCKKTLIEKYHSHWYFWHNYSGKSIDFVLPSYILHMSPFACMLALWVLSFVFFISQLFKNINLIHAVNSKLQTDA